MKLKTSFSLFTLATLSICGAGFIKSNQSSSNLEATSFQYRASQGEIDSYYSSISDDLTGKDLLNALNSLNSSKKKKNVTYAGMKTFAKECDADPDGSGKILGFYDNTLVGPNWDSAKTWNREHVWPDARGGNLVEGDAHMPRPASIKANSSRGSKGFSENESFDPGYEYKYYRGVCARIIFYSAIANTSLKLIEDPLNNNTGSPKNSMGKLSDMLKWNLEYLPTDTSYTGGDDLARRAELNRNDVIQNHKDGQGNRNPFIDHPEYACRIWGNENDATRAVCSSTPSEPKITSITIEQQPTKKNYEVGENLDLTGLVVKANYNKELAPIDVTSEVTPSITKFNTPGNQTVTLTYTCNDGTFTASFSVTVTGEVLPVLQRLEIVSQPTKTSYEVGESFDKAGLKVMAHYSNGDPKEVTNDVSVSPDKFTYASESKAVTLTYSEGGVTVSVDLYVEVKEKTAPDTPTKGCGGDIVVTSTILASIALAGIALIFISKIIRKKHDK